MTNCKPILYAEDDENDVFFMQRAFRLLSIPNPLIIASDGRQAMAYLNGTPPHENREQPCLLLLDLSMPGQHGLDVLKWLRNEPLHVNLPVIVLTSSNQESDIHRAFLLGANGFIIKPGDPKQLVNIVKTIQDYWLGEIRPPVSFVDFAAAANVAVLAGLYNGRKGPP